MAGLIIRGGFPANIVYSPKDWSKTISEYIKIIIEDDLIRLDGVNRDKHKVKLLLKSLFEALVERDLKIYADSFMLNVIIIKIIKMGKLIVLLN